MVSDTAARNSVMDVKINQAIIVTTYVRGARPHTRNHRKQMTQMLTYKYATIQTETDTNRMKDMPKRKYEYIETYVKRVSHFSLKAHFYLAVKLFWSFKNNSLK